MHALLALSRGIDRASEWIGRSVAWLVLLAVLISAGNAIARKAFALTSNGMLEIQWYLFAAIFLLAAGYTLLRQEHVRIDVVLARFPRRTQVQVEVFGLLAFLLPFALYTIWLVMPLVLRSFAEQEMSPNAGGLIRWPVYALVPLGLALLALQAASEVIKRVAFLQGIAADPGVKQQAKTAEQELAEEIRRQAEAAARAGTGAPR